MAPMDVITCVDFPYRPVLIQLTVTPGPTVHLLRYMAMTRRYLRGGRCYGVYLDRLQKHPWQNYRATLRWDW